MAAKMRILAAVLFLLAMAQAEATPAPPRASFNGHKVFRVPVRTKTQRVDHVVAKLGLDFWQPASRKGAFADIQVSPDKLDAFRREMEGLELITMHEDLGRSISEEAAFQVYAEGSANDTWFDSYHPYEDHLQYLRDLQNQHPNSDMVTSGQSLEGNAITSIHLYGSSGKGSKLAIVFHGTVHAREWIASMVVKYFAHSLLNGYQNDAEVRGFLDKYDFYLFPIVNPDDFKYTQTSNRMWRKNRQRHSRNRCVGRDLNRNWPYQWDGPGSSENPCAESFRGERAGDSPETTALIDFIQKVKDA